MLEDMCLEMSGAGHGDIREPFVSLVYPDGSRSVDFLYEKSTLSNQKEPLQTLPCAYTENGKTEHLIVELRDGALVMELHYTVYPPATSSRAAPFCSTRATRCRWSG